MSNCIFCAELDEATEERDACFRFLQMAMECFATERRIHCRIHDGSYALTGSLNREIIYLNKLVEDLKMALNGVMNNCGSRGGYDPIALLKFTACAEALLAQKMTGGGE